MDTGFKKRVLMIDPSRFACLAIGKLLSRDSGLSFRYSTRVDAALRVADAFLPTVVLFSPDAGDGRDLEALRSLRNNPSTRDVPVIVLSDLEDETLRGEALSLGAEDLLEKSGSSTELLNRIRESSRRYIETLRKEIPAGAETEVESAPARVLMIDDSRTVCMSVERIMADEKNTVFAYCTDPSRGLSVAKEFGPTVILLDLEMPGITGFDLLPTLREDPLTRRVPIIVLSGITEAATKAQAFALGANDYVEKNMDRVEVVSRVQYHTRGYLNAIKLDESINQLLEAKKRLEVQGNFIRKTFGRYLSDEVVDSILETPEGLELGGEKRVISIMMADLRGFTSLGERLPPEKVLSIINTFLKTMTEILARYNATIDEFIGDAILAMFGAPVRREDDARRAVACAVEMQLAMEEVNRWNRRQGLPEVAMGIGINTGDVIVGNIGSERRAKYGIVGRNVNLTARIESCTVGGQILVSESTLRACGAIVRVDGEMEVMPKGLIEPITIYEVGGIGGGLDLYLPLKEKVEIPPLEPPLKVRLSVLEGKHAARESHRGSLTGLAGNDAVLRPGIPLEGLTDLKITLLDRRGNEISSELYAKVVQEIAEKPPVVQIRFTAVPPEAERFLREQRSSFDESG